MVPTMMRRFVPVVVALLVVGCSPAKKCKSAFFGRPSVYEFERCKRGCDEERDAQSCSFTSNVYRFGAGKGYSGGRDPRSALRYAKRA